MGRLGEYSLGKIATPFISYSEERRILEKLNLLFSSKADTFTLENFIDALSNQSNMDVINEQVAKLWNQLPDFLKIPISEKLIAQKLPEFTRRLYLKSLELLQKKYTDTLGIKYIELINQKIAKEKHMVIQQETLKLLFERVKDRFQATIKQVIQATPVPDKEDDNTLLTHLLYTNQNGKSIVDQFSEETSATIQKWLQSKKSTIHRFLNNNLYLYESQYGKMSEAEKGGYYFFHQLIWNTFNFSQNVERLIKEEIQALSPDRQNNIDTDMIREAIPKLAVELLIFAYKEIQMKFGIHLFQHLTQDDKYKELSRYKITW